MAQAHGSGRPLTPNGGQISPGGGGGGGGFSSGYLFGEGALVVSGAKATLDGASGVFRPPNADRSKPLFSVGRPNGSGIAGAGGAALSSSGLNGSGVPFSGSCLSSTSPLTSPVHPGAPSSSSLDGMDSTYGRIGRGREVGDYHPPLPPPPPPPPPPATVSAPEHIESARDAMSRDGRSIASRRDGVSIGSGRDSLGGITALNPQRISC